MAGCAAVLSGRSPIRWSTFDLRLQRDLAPVLEGRGRPCWLSLAQRLDSPCKRVCAHPHLPPALASSSSASLDTPIQAAMAFTAALASPLAAMHRPQQCFRPRSSRAARCVGRAVPTLACRGPSSQCAPPVKRGDARMPPWAARHPPDGRAPPPAAAPLPRAHPQARRARGAPGGYRPAAGAEQPVGGAQGAAGARLGPGLGRRRDRRDPEAPPAGDCAAD